MPADEVLGFEESRRRIDEAIAALNKKHKNILRIVWGGSDKDDREWQTLGGEEVLHQQYGLLNHQAASGSRDYEVLLTHAGDSDFPDICSISVEFEEPQVLPRDPRHLYNVLKCCADGVALSIVPDCLEDDVDPDILVTGVSVSIAIEQITARTFYHAFSEMRSSGELAYRQLKDQEGDDHWGREA